MDYFAVELTGLPAFLIIVAVLYIFIYLPLKLVISVIAKGKQKTDHVRLLRQKTVIAEYSAPADLTPSELGFLYDSKLSTAEVYATIIALQQQGLVVLEETDSGLIIGETRQAPLSLKEADKYVLGILGENRAQALTKRLLEKMLSAVQLIIKRQLYEQGYLVSPIEQIKRSFIRLGLIACSLMALTIFGLFRHSLSDPTGPIFFAIFFSPFYFFISIFLYLKFKKIAGEPWLGSPKLKTIWPEIEGYHQYISLVEIDNLKFDSEDTKQAIKDKNLPYAIAFDFNTGWLDKLK